MTEVSGETDAERKEQREGGRKREADRLEVNTKKRADYEASRQQEPENTPYNIV